MGDQIITDDQAKANVLTDQFQSVFSDEDPILPTLPPSCFPDIPEINVTTEWVRKLLGMLKTNKAVGPDDLPNIALKTASDELAPALQFIFQQSLDGGELPEDWKMANICSIFKKGSKSDPANYRPISLTCVCCKLIEHIIDSHLMKHLTYHHVFSDCRHAFRKARSCETQLITTLHDLNRSRRSRNKQFETTHHTSAPHIHSLSLLKP